MNKLLRGFYAGTLIIFAASVVVNMYLIIHGNGPVFLLILSPIIASIATAYLSPKYKFLFGLSMSVVFGVHMIFNTIIYEYYAHRIEGYFYGLAALWAFFILSLPFCALGSLLGIFFWKRDRNRENSIIDAQSDGEYH
jgi:hypothetical protein